MKIQELASALSDAFQTAAAAHPGRGDLQWQAVARQAVQSIGDEFTPFVEIAVVNDVVTLHKEDDL